MPAQLVMCYSSLISAIALPDPLAASLGRKEKWTKGPETPQLLCSLFKLTFGSKALLLFRSQCPVEPNEVSGALPPPLSL